MVREPWERSGSATKGFGKAGVVAVGRDGTDDDHHALGVEARWARKVGRASGEDQAEAQHLAIIVVVRGKHPLEQNALGQGWA